jgi:hypothetical protein
MDQYTRRIIQFGVHPGTLNGVALGRMFNRSTSVPTTIRFIGSTNGKSWKG